MDFREVLRANNNRTRLVIGSYIFIMFLVGLLAVSQYGVAVPFRDKAASLGLSFLDGLLANNFIYSSSFTLLCW